MILNDLEQKFKITKDCINFLFANASRGITSEIYHANVIALRFPAVTKYENILFCTACLIDSVQCDYEWALLYLETCCLFLAVDCVKCTCIAWRGA